MSALLKTLKAGQILNIRKILTTTERSGVRKCHWYPDYVPGPYPKTKEEREAAARKYNLLPEEYEPYPNDETGCGDYPKLPYRSVDSRDSWYPWDMPNIRKDIFEPVRYDMIHLVPEGISTDESDELAKNSGIFLFLFSVIIILSYLGKKVVYLNTVSEKQYPAEGVVHYTFDLMKEDH